MTADVVPVPNDAKVGDPCPHCDGTLMLDKMIVYFVRCDLNSLHRRGATEDEIREGESVS